MIRLGSGSRLAGGTVHNTAKEDCFDVDVAAGARGAVIDDVTFRGSRTNALYVNAPDVHGLTVQNSRFVGTVYGVLVNSLSLRARGIHVLGNTFVHTTGDAIELNTPAQNSTDAVRDVVISRNIVDSMRGSGTSSGFAIGIAGVRGFRIEDNRLLHSRTEAIHLEAGARDGVVRRNLIRGGGGGGYHPAVAIYRTVDRVRVERNVIERFRGSGVAALWDSVGSSTRISVIRNLVRDVTGDGIVMGGDTGTGPFVSRRNAVIRSQNGIVSLGVHQRDVVVDNLIRAVRARPIVSAYQGRSQRTVAGNTVSTARTIRSVVGADVVALSRSKHLPVP